MRCPGDHSTGHTVMPEVTVIGARHGTLFCAQVLQVHSMGKRLHIDHLPVGAHLHSVFEMGFSALACDANGSTRSPRPSSSVEALTRFPDPLAARHTFAHPALTRITAPHQADGHSWDRSRPLPRGTGAPWTGLGTLPGHRFSIGRRAYLRITSMHSSALFKPHTDNKISLVECLLHPVLPSG